MSIVTYTKEAYAELVHKVSWPSVSQLQSSAIVVMIASLIFSIVILSMDVVFENLMHFIYKTLY